MKALKLFTIAACLLASVFAAKAFFYQNKTTHTNIADAKNNGFALVELFTSEGCSSCPPADALVAKIETEMANQPVYILAYHVDYWNRLGWKDVFSDAAYSNRQNQYANWLKLQSVYTPQIIVNGQTEFVGSQENSLRNAIGLGIKQTVSEKLKINNVKIVGNKINLEYVADNAPAETSILIAVVQKNATIDVKRGENAGRKLSHVQIVQKLETIALKTGGKGIAQIDIPANVLQQDLELIAFLQNNTNGKIIAATKTSF